MMSRLDEKYEVAMRRVAIAAKLRGIPAKEMLVRIVDEAVGLGRPLWNDDYFEVMAKAMKGGAQ